MCGTSIHGETIPFVYESGAQSHPGDYGIDIRIHYSAEGRTEVEDRAEFVEWTVSGSYSHSGASVSASTKVNWP